MRQFFLKSVLSLSLSVGALSASTNSTDLSDPATSASTSALSASLAVTEQERHPSSIPMPCLRDIEDENGEVIAQAVDIGFLKAAAQETPFVMQEILSHLDFKDCFNLYKAGYINGFMWKAVEGKKDFLNADDVPHKLLLVALAIQTKAPHLFIQDQAAAFGQLSLASLREIFDSGDLRGYFHDMSTTRARYDYRRIHGTWSERGENFRLLPPQKAGYTTSVDYGHNFLTVLADLEWPAETERVDLDTNSLVTLPSFSRAVNLRYINASSNRLRILPGLGQKTNLQTLNIKQNELTHIDGLEDLVGLKDLQMGRNNLAGSLDLSNLTRLFTLSLDYNQLTEVKGLEMMASLNYLALSGNPLRSMPSFRSLQNLTFLMLNQTGFTNLQDLRGLLNLNVCRLAGNELVTLETFPSVPFLNHLDIENNHLTSLEPLTRLQNLYILQISGNPLDTLGSLEHLSSLSALWMDNMTRLTSLSSMPVATRGRLDFLRVFGNSFTHLPELADMGRLHTVSLTQAQWENPQNRSYLTTLIQNDIQGRGPSVFTPVIQNDLTTSSVCVRDRNVGAHGAPIN